MPQNLAAKYGLPLHHVTLPKSFEEQKSVEPSFHLPWLKYRLLWSIEIDRRSKLLITFTFCFSRYQGLAK
jgi:hypothetical protein